MRSDPRSRGTPWLALFATIGLFALILAGCSFFPSDAAQLGGKKYAVVVGINDYINNNAGLPDLNYCVADAQGIAKMLSDSGWNTGSNQVVLITAESNELIYQYATKAKIKAAIQNAPSDADTFLFYFSGHGYLDPTSETSYIVPSDCDNSPSNITSTSISTSEFASWLATVPATNKSVMLDSCDSGGFVNPGDSLDSAYDYTDLNTDTTYLQKTSSVTMLFSLGELLAKDIAAASNNPSDAPLVISAAGRDALSWEVGGSISHGLFTYYILEAAQKGTSGYMNGDADQDGVLSCLEAYHYAEVKLEAQANQFGYVPHISGGLRDFALIDTRQ